MSPQSTGNDADQERAIRPLMKSGLNLHRAGRMGEAEAAFRQILEIDPHHAPAHQLLAQLALHGGRPQEAAAIARRAFEHRPNPRILGILGTACLHLGDHAAAAEAFESALRLDPKNAEAQLGLGNLSRIQGDKETALRHYRGAVDANFALTEAHMNLGLLLVETGQTDEGIAHLEDALALRPDDLEILANLGFANARKDPEAAIAWLQRALAARPNHVRALTNLAAIHARLGRSMEAAECARRALAVDPANPGLRLQLAARLLETNALAESRHLFEEIAANHPATLEAHLGLARLSRLEGRLDDARAHFARALVIDARCPGALAALTELQDPSLTDVDFGRMESLAEDARTSARDRSRLHFALAAVTDRRGEHDRAFAHLQRANRLRLSELEGWGRGYDRVAEEAQIQSLISAFDAAHVERLHGAGNASEGPVFIVGMPQSGASLCERLLARHSRVHAGGERTEMARLTERLPEEILKVAGTGAPDYPACVADLTPDLATRLADAYLHDLRSLSPAAARITDRAPGNLRHLGIIAILFPRARIIHCRRNAMDACFSCYSQNLDQPHAWCCDFAALAHHYRLHERLMAHWRATLPIKMLDIDYADIERDVEGAARALVAFCGLEWEDRSLDCRGANGSADPAAELATLRSADEGAVGSWQAYEPRLTELRQALQMPDQA